MMRYMNITVARTSLLVLALTACGGDDSKTAAGVRLDPELMHRVDQVLGDVPQRDPERVG